MLRLLFGSLTLVVVFDNVGARSPKNGFSATGRDPVCHMDVGDKITASVERRSYYFCTKRCRDLFLDEPESFIDETCPVCSADRNERVSVHLSAPTYTWQGNRYRFCSEQHRDTFANDPAGYFIHTMWGIPTWLYAVSVGLILVLSFGLFEFIARRRRARQPVRVNLFLIPGLVRVFRWPPFRFLCQLLFVVLFLLIVAAGLFGDQLSGRNIAPLLTWTLWWGGLVILIMFLGKAWCYVCPWDAIAGWIERLRFWGKNERSSSLELRWPRPLRNIVIATVLFVGLTWLELGFGVTMSPRSTA
ncbi:MAG: YHS domain-containing protein, partial [Planctomycetota bacterium]